MNGTEETQARLAAALDGLEYRSAESADRIPVLEVERDALLEILSRLQERAGFETVTFVTAVDHLTSRTGGDRREIEPRFQVSIQLHSLEHEARVRVRIPVSSDDASLPSCTGLWPGANFMERECYDMFGIRFDGHPNLKRLLMPEGYGHHPLRKDFPHKGIEPDRLYREWDRDRRKAQAATEGEAR